MCHGGTTCPSPLPPSRTITGFSILQSSKTDRGALITPQMLGNNKKLFAFYRCVFEFSFWCGLNKAQQPYLWQRSTVCGPSLDRIQRHFAGFISGESKINIVMECAQSEQKLFVSRSGSVLFTLLRKLGANKHTTNLRLCSSRSLLFHLAPFLSSDRATMVIPFPYSQSFSSLSVQQGRFASSSYSMGRVGQSQIIRQQKNDTLHFVVHIPRFPSLNPDRPDLYIPISRRCPQSAVQNVHCAALIRAEFFHRTPAGHTAERKTRRRRPALLDLVFFGGGCLAFLLPGASLRAMEFIVE